MTQPLPETGAIIGLSSHPDTPIVRVQSVDMGGYNPSLTYESGDGYSEIVISSMWRSVPEAMAGWRPASEEEAAAFLRTYRKPPQNWN